MEIDPDVSSGIRDTLPLAVSVVPFSAILAATAVGVGFSPLQTVLMGAFVFAGAAQAAVVELVGRNAPAGVVVLAGLVVNLRYVMYSGSLAPHLERLSIPRRAGLSTLLIDQVYALTITRFEADPGTDEWRYFLSVGVTMWVAWMASHAVGAVLGARIPGSLQLEFVLPLVFVTLLFSAVEDRATKAAAAASAIVATLGAGLPFNTGLIVGVVFGIAAGLAIERGSPWR